MSARNTGFTLIACNSVQEVMDLGLVAQLATMKTPDSLFWCFLMVSEPVMNCRKLMLAVMKQ